MSKPPRYRYSFPFREGWFALGLGWQDLGHGHCTQDTPKTVVECNTDLQTKGTETDMGVLTIIEAVLTERSRRSDRDMQAIRFCNLFTSYSQNQVATALDAPPPQQKKNPIASYTCCELMRSYLLSLFTYT